eukprot:TRINITY_DN10220_c0_g1_i1.p1 TRINITY_DN10220_c0_g1~~TRINITY_DN10220_c0_g1_i1.p1  ORF type:complete len:300 (+),score=95.66 TRINITY_DN10220_c0_g1_i1:44-943(+)
MAGDTLATLAIYAATGYAAFVFAPWFAPEDGVFLMEAIAGMVAFRVLSPHLLAGPVFNLIEPSYPDEEVRAASQRKFCAHFNKFCIHLLFQLWGLRVLLAESWFDPNDWLNIEPMWEGWNADEKSVSGDFREFYLAQMSFFLGSLVMQPFEPRSHDHIAMLAHHAGASTLVACSFVFNCHRIGLLILVVRELTDVMIHAARGLALLQFKLLSEVTLVSLTVAWAVTRNWYYGCVICPVVWNAPLYQHSVVMWKVCMVLCALLVPLDLYYLLLATMAILRRVMGYKMVDPDAPESKKKRT